MRLNLMREQALLQQQNQVYHSGDSNIESGGGAVPSNGPQQSATINSGKSTQPIIISQPIRFTGNRLIHLPPQIIHVAKVNIL